MTDRLPLASATSTGPWLADPAHRAYLGADVKRHFDFFQPSLRADGGYDVLDLDGTPLPRGPQELHVTTRHIHSYALGKAAGHDGADDIIDAGMDFLWRQHRDATHGGYMWSVGSAGAVDTKLAYGHVFVLLAASSARQVGHPDAERLHDDIRAVLERHFWDETHGLLREEFRRDFTAFSTYRGMNANMHGVEAMLAAFEATGDDVWLTRAGRILDFFVGRIAPAHNWRMPEHYDETWQQDPDYAGDPMFRPAGSTPGHSFELARLQLQHWDLAGRPDNGAPERARHLVEQALADATLPAGGLAYTLDLAGNVAIADRYWWPVTEAIGALAALIKISPSDSDEAAYRALWTFADAHMVDHARGGWFPELDDSGKPVGRQFEGKPDIYHSLQASLFALLPGVSAPFADLRRAAAG